MLKGKSKIELFDAATGTKLLEQRDTNLVTDALDVLANCREKSGLLKWWEEEKTSKERFSVNPIHNMKPLYKRALGGILLWDGNIAEDPSIVIPPSGVTEVGHAGGVYAGADIYRGSYNLNESGEISGGYRHVWDFDTDKANGVIKCLTLTSWHGGNVGYHGCFEDDDVPLYNSRYFHSDCYFDYANDSVSIARLDDGTKGRMLYIRKMEDSSLRIYKKNDSGVWYLKVPDPTKITLFTTGLTFTEKVNLPITPINNTCTMYVYKGQIHEVAQLNTTQLQHRIFSLDGEQISNKTLDLTTPFSSTFFGNPGFYRDGYYYYFTHNDTDLIKLDEQGNEVGRIKALSDADDAVRSLTINDFNGEVLIGIKPVYYKYNTSLTVYSLNDSDTVYALSHYSTPPVLHNDSNASMCQYVKTDDPNSPFIFYSDAYVGNIIVLVNTGYLATINNLQSPITKTPAQTMKITYEIYDE